MFPDTAYNYSSPGIVKLGESIELFDDGLIPGESIEQANKRSRNLLNRRDESYVLTYEYKGKQFIESFGDDRRLYYFKGSVNVDRRENNALLIFGIFMIVIGAFVFAYKNPFTESKS